MTRRYAFEEDARAKGLEAEVLSTDTDDSGTFVVLSDTVLYPEGGGQPRDEGTVAGREVTNLLRSPEGLRHYLSPDPGEIRTGATVAVRLNWPRRFDHMQQHTAQHLLTALAHTHLGRSTTSFHLGEQSSDIELDGPSLSELEQLELEGLAAEAVRANHLVGVHWIPRDEYDSRTDIRTRGLPEHHQGEVRLIDIDGVDLTACGGTHVASTAEIETIKLLGTESMRGGTRLHWVAGERVRGRLGVHESRTGALRSLLGVADEELTRATESKLAQLKEAQKRVRVLEEELVDVVLAGFIASEGPLISAHFEDKSGSFLRSLAARFADRAETQVAFFTAEDEGGTGFALAAGGESSVAVDQLGPKVAEVLEGRGGGRGRTFQGKATSLERREDAVRELEKALAP